VLRASPTGSRDAPGPCSSSARSRNRSRR
jgi:hypothetical protein